MATETPEPKRPSTDGKAAMLSPNPADHTVPSTMIEESLADRIRATSFRTRQAVQRGYATDINSSKTSAPRTMSLPNGNIFRSSNDTLRDIYSASATDAVPPTRIRPRSTSKRVLDTLQDAELEEAEAEDQLGLDSVPKIDMTSRRIRPLGKATRSTPSSIFGARAEAGEPKPSASASAQPEPEEDWSMDGNSGSAAFEPITL